MDQIGKFVLHSGDVQSGRWILASIFDPGCFFRLLLFETYFTIFRYYLKLLILNF